MSHAPAELRAGLRDAAAVVPSVLVYAAVWGGLARQAGLSLGETVAMCLLVSAGTAQVVALRMLSAGAPALLVALLATRTQNLLVPVAAGVLLVAGLRALMG